MQIKACNISQRINCPAPFNPQPECQASPSGIQLHPKNDKTNKLFLKR